MHLFAGAGGFSDIIERANERVPLTGNILRGKIWAEGIKRGMMRQRLVY